MAIELVFETHSTSVDNETGCASGWLPGDLSDTGRRQAAELGRRRQGESLAAVFASDLRRAVETASIAFAGRSTPPVLLDWRLRECDFGSQNGMPAELVHGDKRRHLDVPYPHGESWRQAVHRVGRFLDDLPLRWRSTRVLVIGHAATRWALEHYVNGVPLEHLATQESGWQPGWAYVLDA